MKQYLKYALTVAVTAAAMVAYQYEGKPDNAGLAQQAPSQVPEIKNEIGEVEQSLAGVEEPSAKRELTQAELVDIDPASIDWEAVTSRYSITAGSGYDPMIMRWSHLGGFTESEIAAFNKLHVVPFNPKIDESCEDIDTGVDGLGPKGNGIAEFCDEIKQFPDHEYANVELEKLLDLSKVDPAAAVFASRKVEDRATKISLALHAAVLSEKSGPILEVAIRELSFFTIEGRPYADIMADAADSLVLHKLASVLGDPRAKPQKMEAKLGELSESTDDYTYILGGVNEAVQKILEDMAQAQRETTGSTHIWEIINA